ncbi:vomeronasal type-1 receptor 4-like [Trichosurus vulpecula]|uniref:vomeronasal type-1 receptor 4-like n=1 Tax=Trichosurus vulpecula TaxID=9337 RepID=UPI00186B1497|nr:vomeronasal type-1 receptor 4-like [Trichosurus vulpecula]
MTFNGEVLGIVYLVQTLIGVLGNIFLIYHYSFHFITQKRPRRINLILIQLSFANAIFLLSRGIPTVIFSWEVNIFLSNAKCVIISYLQRAFRGLSLCTTCLLSSFQAIAISPNSPKWVVLKVKSPQGIIPCCVFCWILNLLMDAALPVYGARLIQNSTNIKGREKQDFCSVKPYDMNSLKFQIWKSFYDSVFVLLMAVISGYMVVLLYQHHQQVQHIHITRLFPRASPEIRATKAILLLVSTFFFFNTTSCVLSNYSSYYEVSRPWLFYVPLFLSMSFQAVSPFVLISSETWVPWEFCYFLQEMKDSCATPITCQTHTEPQNQRFGRWERKLETI